jgi:hypothetical protein
MSLRDTCLAAAPLLTVPLAPFEGEPVDTARLLWALAGIESTYGRDREYCRIEPAYQPTGDVYRKSQALRDLWRRYGALAACSLGTWQMMAITARELGHSGHPIELQADAALVYLVVRYLERARPATLPDVFDAYNSGSCRDRIIPDAYIRSGLAAYRAGWTRGPQG